MEMSRYKKIRCPNCGKVIFESTTEYDFSNTEEPTARYLCPRCKKMIFFKEKQNTKIPAAKK